VISFFIFVNLAQGGVSQFINEDTTWTKDQNPILLMNKQIIIPDGITLVIEPGVIVKSDFGSGIAVLGGNLMINGTIDDPVVFTSIHDVEYGGVENPTTVFNYWGGIKLWTGSESIIENAIIRQAGSPGYRYAVDSKNSNLEISNSLITNNASGVNVNGGNVSISNSSIYNNRPIMGWYLGADVGVYAHSAFMSASNNWWGSSDGPCPWRELVDPSISLSDINFESVCGEKPLVDGTTYNPWLDYNPLEQKRIDPVILIPGILGSWNFDNGDWQLDPIFNTYDNLWEALKLAGYEEGVNLFALPYDWNNSSVDTARELKNKIDEVKNICECDKIDLVAHSMGGLVARAYIQDDDYQSDVDQLIFLATPHLGSPKAYLMWEGGESGLDFQDWLTERFFALLADSSGFDSIFHLIRENPIHSIGELLPIYDYLKRKDSDGNWQLVDYGDGYPRNLFLEELNSDEGLARLEGIDITNIVADAGENSTVNSLRVIDKDFDDEVWSHGYPEGYYSLFGDHGIEYGDGDQTVASNSNAGFLGLEDIVIESSHNQVVTDAQKIVIRELTGEEPMEEVRKNIFSKFLMIRIFSPADFVVVDPNGQLVGRDFSGSGVINEIEDSFYTGFDSDIELALIPNPIDGEYQVQLMGTGEGEYKLSASYITSDMVVDSDFLGIISPGEVDNYGFGINGDEISELAPEIKSLSKLLELIEEMYHNNLISHFGNKNALVKRLENQPDKNQINGLYKFLDNMFFKDRLNQQSYDIINLALNNIYK
jgi:pimeloyl-ACP methyl ester carboxylesterase